jgi:uncharacterized protein YndB with AHSA1/START domain
MTSHREQALLDSPVEDIWALVATPKLFPAWWPRVIEVEGERFEEGDEFVQVTRDPMRNVRTNFLIERRDELREIRMKCDLTGAYAHWRLTAAQSGTFVELEMGMQPRRVSDRLADMTVGRIYFRRWSQSSLDALREAARPSATEA